jgi:hypothetical protein
LIALMVRPGQARSLVGGRGVREILAEVGTRRRLRSRRAGAEVEAAPRRAAGPFEVYCWSRPTQPGDRAVPRRALRRSGSGVRRRGASR